MFQKGLSQSTRQNLAILAKIPDISSFYLAGGTAIALNLGHRLSFDLDFFTQKAFSGSGLARKIQEYGNFSLEQVLEDTLLGKLNGEKVSFFLYQYPLLKPRKSWKKIYIASLSDLAAMKIEAIGGRGRKRDFIDLYFISRKISIRSTLYLYDKKYKALASNLPHLIKSLGYFEDAEEDEMPQMLEQISWEGIKEFFTKEVKKISQELLRIG